MEWMDLVEYLDLCIMALRWRLVITPKSALGPIDGVVVFSFHTVIRRKISRSVLRSVPSINTRQSMKALFIETISRDLPSESFSKDVIEVRRWKQVSFASRITRACLPASNATACIIHRPRGEPTATLHLDVDDYS